MSQNSAAAKQRNAGPPMRTDPDAEVAIDLVHLSRRTLGDGALEIELLRLFDRQAQGLAAQLRAIAPARDPRAEARLAKALKGSARAVGAFALAAAAERLEVAAENLSPERDLCRKQLEEAIEQAHSEVALLMCGGPG